jgi:putative spermidine/putrescine transport system ATP-binding protein/spermidine/putrescine transport system ATP-binding protein
LTTPTHSVELSGIVKRFGDFTAVERMDLSIEEGSFVTLLGPSGCGKTTTLRMIAGLLDPSEGDIRIRGRSVTAIPIHKRNLGLVFQNYALFPHKTIYDNVAFGLKYRDIPKSEIAGKVQRALDLVQLPDVGSRHPRQLSGGQQQRIALARAIVIEPDVLLLDEPLSALDANLREDMRVELKRIQAQLGITTIFVTHDQSEALAMSDTIVVMSNGHVEQVGGPEDVYVNPTSAFVARFLGNSNLLPARVGAREGDVVPVTVDGFGTIRLPASRCTAVGESDRATLVVRSENLRLAGDDAPVPGDALALPADVTTVDYQGQAARYFVRIGDKTLQAVNAIEMHPHRQGARVKAIIRGRDCTLVPEERH